MRFLELLRKEFLHLKQDWGVIIILFLVPIFLIIVMGIAFSDEEQVYKLGFVDYDQSHFSGVVLNILEKVDALEIVTYGTEKEGTDALNKAQIAGCLVIPLGFDKDHEEGMANATLILDNAYPINSSILENIVMRVFEPFNTKVMSVLTSIRTFDTLAPEIPTESVLEEARGYVIGIERKPIEITYEYVVPQVRGGGMSSFNQTTAGMTAMFILFLCILWGSGNILEERLTGTLTRLVLAPIGTATIISAKMAYIGILSSLQVATFFSIGHFFLDVPIGNPLLLGILSVLFIVQATSIGLLVSLLVRSRIAAIGVSFFIIMFLSPLGGLWFPLEIMPKAMQTIASLLPSGAYMLGLEKIMLRNGDFLSILPSIAVIFVYFVVTFLASTEVGIKSEA